VLWPIARLRAIARWVCPAARSRSTSLILRMDNLSAAIDALQLLIPRPLRGRH
jgi:hypothetical protein